MTAVTELAAWVFDWQSFLLGVGAGCGIALAILIWTDRR